MTPYAEVIPPAVHRDSSVPARGTAVDIGAAFGPLVEAMSAAVQAANTGDLPQLQRALMEMDDASHRISSLASTAEEAFDDRCAAEREQRPCSLLYYDAMAAQVEAGERARLAAELSAALRNVVPADLQAALTAAVLPHG